MRHQPVIPIGYCKTIEDPENAKRFVQAQYQRGRIPYHVMASLARDRNWTDWPAVEKPAALICGGATVLWTETDRIEGSRTSDVCDLGSRNRVASADARRCWMLSN